MVTFHFTRLAVSRCCLSSLLSIWTGTTHTSNCTLESPGMVVHTSNCMLDSPGMVVPSSIPPALQPPNRVPIQAGRETEVVIFDLETTRLDRDCQIFQLTATTGSSKFCCFTLPTKPISAKAKEVNGFDVTVRGGRRVLLSRVAIVDTVSTHKCLEPFCNWLLAKCVLVAHNCFAFDARVLRAVAGSMLEEKMVGFGDTLPLFRQAMPEETLHKLGDSLVATMGIALPDAHSALGDVRGLRRILDERSISNSSTSDFCAPLAYFDAKDAYRNVVEEAKCTLVCPLGPVLSKGIINKIAESGLRYRHLKLAHQRDPQSGLQLLLADKSADFCHSLRTEGL